jgi:maleate isomerase
MPLLRLGESAPMDRPEREAPRPHPMSEAVTMFGWRLRIGLILPADNTVAEPELYSLRLSGVSFHTVRLSATEHEAMRREAVVVAHALDEMAVDVVAYACAETSFDAGKQGRDRLSALIREACDIPIVTATDAMLAALCEIDAKRLALVTPYTQRSGALLEATFSDHGLEVVSSLHRDFREGSEDPRVWYETNRQPATTAYRMARKADVSDADAVLLSSTNLTTLPLLEQLEQDLGKPVVSTNQSILWWCLRELQVKGSVDGCGSLLRRPR